MRRATLLCIAAIAGLVAAAPRDSAIIINSGSTNTIGYAITVWSDGKASLTTQNRDGSPAGPAKPFSVAPATAARFFADLATAKNAKAATVPCMKSASFGSSMHVKWQDWTSPDLECPPKTSAGDALVKDVDDIRQASGLAQTPLRPPQQP
ncbi:MAG: hypothetical protein JO190_08380 [Candidatus Eremiobacteraeota bacterium]|nr:hypothetical protein [Candidatus Eremiobacteraeota bacterium]